ncbi:branched-chain amino acid ABC transporter permease [Effusibacillus pohliae]|uniref:branched-chain amino acid ABC transporter permease n=1 Tax=Effusibacillus pohliae TaxID=232270 RepID=UPI0003698F83|nr:branched-chain amino acid ABC transporter permease [Effusibacillus pohliae]
MSSRIGRGLGYAILFLLLASIPYAVSSYFVSIVTEILILGIFALSLNILVGYTGLVSLGHAAYFGVGAYTTSLFAIHISPNLFVSLLAGLIVSGVVAAVVGFFCNRVSGFYFLMLTLAFSQMVYVLVYRWSSLTGGDNGLAGVPRPVLAEGFSMQETGQLYVLVLLVFALTFLCLKVVLYSPFGRIFVGIRENETRMKAIGYNPTFYKNAAFILAGGLAGVAGSLYSYFNGFVSPKDMYWTMSGEVLIMVLIGGAGTLLGPVLGAAFMVVLETIVSSYTDLWMLIVGLTFLLFVIFVPKGIVGLTWRGKTGRAANRPAPVQVGSGKSVSEAKLERNGV